MLRSCHDSNAYLTLLRLETIVLLTLVRLGTIASFWASFNPNKNLNWSNIVREVLSKSSSSIWNVSIYFSRIFSSFEVGNCVYFSSEEVVILDRGFHVQHVRILTQSTFHNSIYTTTGTKLALQAWQHACRANFVTVEEWTSADNLDNNYRMFTFKIPKFLNR